MSDELQKTKEGREAIETFFSQFEKDAHSKIVLEYIFEQIIKKQEVKKNEKLHLHDKKG